MEGKSQLIIKDKLVFYRCCPSQVPFFLGRNSPANAQGNEIHRPLEKDIDARKRLRQGGKQTTEDKMVRYH